MPSTFQSIVFLVTARSSFLSSQGNSGSQLSSIGDKIQTSSFSSAEHKLNNLRVSLEGTSTTPPIVYSLLISPNAELFTFVISFGYWGKLNGSESFAATEFDKPSPVYFRAPTGRGLASELVFQNSPNQVVELEEHADQGPGGLSEAQKTIYEKIVSYSYLVESDNSVTKVAKMSNTQFLGTESGVPRFVVSALRYYTGEKILAASLAVVEEEKGEFRFLEVFEVLHSSYVLGSYRFFVFTHGGVEYKLILSMKEESGDEFFCAIYYGGGGDNYWGDSWEAIQVKEVHIKEEVLDGWFKDFFIKTGEDRDGKNSSMGTISIVVGIIVVIVAAILVLTYWKKRTKDRKVEISK